ncbi:aldo/keto reductase [Rhodococcus jostii]|uniref:aldo/keto reductase n=1 Tax=Rhodococcus jostii TaxID=132919 RepID=UPI000AABDE29|nr:aldo/keto reductase [Rhodococcus jostii]
MVRAIGIGVNEADVCVDALERVDLDCVLLAGRYTLLEQDPVKDLLPLAVERAVAVVLGGVFNSGILATGAVPRAKFNYQPAPDEVRSRVRAIEKFCERHRVPLAAASIQFAAAHPAVRELLLGARNCDQLRQNAAWLETPIPAEFWDDLRAADLILDEAPTPT